MPRRAALPALLGLLAGLLAGLPAAARAEGGPGPGCLPPREMREVIDGGEVVAPAMAVIVARRTVPEADVLRAALCRTDEGLVYRIMALRRDGRVVQVVVDAPSGRVVSAR